jgi:hypothetical protein
MRKMVLNSLKKILRLTTYYKEEEGHHYFLEICIYNTYLFKPYFPLGSKELEEAQLELNKICEERGEDWVTNPFDRVGKSIEDFFKNTPKDERIVDRINDLMETIKREEERYKDAKYDDSDSRKVFVEAVQETIKEVDGVPRDDLWDIKTLISDIEGEKKRAIKILSKQNEKLIKTLGISLGAGFVVALTGGIAGAYLAPALAPGIMSVLVPSSATKAGMITFAMSSGGIRAFTQAGVYAYTFWGAAASSHALATIGGSVAGGTAAIATTIGAGAGISGAVATAAVSSVAATTAVNSVAATTAVNSEAATAAAQSIIDDYIENADKIAIYSLAEKIALCKIVYLKYPKERGVLADFYSAEKIVESIKTDIGIHRKSLDELKDKVNSSNAQSKEEKKEADKNKELLKMQEKVLEIYELARDNLQKMIAAWR